MRFMGRSIETLFLMGPIRDHHSDVLGFGGGREIVLFHVVSAPTRHVGRQYGLPKVNSICGEFPSKKVNKIAEPYFWMASFLPRLEGQIVDYMRVPRARMDGADASTNADTGCKTR